MKKTVASTGLVAVLSVCGVRAASMADFLSESAKPWNVSVSLRGFYDDNINSAGGPLKQEAWGFEVRPSIGFLWTTEQTSLRLGYAYDFTYYDHRPTGNTDKYDQNHNFDLGLAHSFSPNVQLSVADSFVIGQEPDVLRADPTFTTFQRIHGDNIRNYGFVNLDVQLSRLFGLQLGYANSYWDYDDDNTFGGTRVSNSGLLDRVEHMVHLDARWQLAPTTVGLIGYQFREVSYTGDQSISLDDPSIKSDSRDSRSHYVYAGAEHTFRPDLTGTLKAGASFIDYYNNGQDDVAPYVSGSLKYVYLPESSVEAGFTYDRNATQLFSDNGNGDITLDAQSATVWCNVRHKFTPHIFGTITGQIQNSSYNGGTLDGKNDLFFLAGVNLEYRFNQYLATSVGYNFDHLDSNVNDPNRDFDRNRVYLGVTASY